MPLLQQFRICANTSGKAASAASCATSCGAACFAASCESSKRNSKNLNFTYMYTWHRGFGHLTIDDGLDQQARFLNIESKVSGKK
jgi:hypothetical protein